MAKDNTVQYHGQTLQLFPGMDRPSYARARVEVQERLDGRVLVSYRGTVLTPGEAPPLPAALRAHANAPRMEPDLEVEATAGVPNESAVDPTAGEPQPRIIWYEDSAIKIHRERVKAGMERARQQGKRIGRPRVTERPEFSQRFAEVMERLGPGELSRRRAAQELGIGYATLKRLLDARTQLPGGDASIACALPALGAPPGR